MLTPRENVDALLRGKKHDYVPLRDGPWADAINAWVRQGYPTHMVHKRVGDKYWQIDGTWPEVEREGEYEEPVPPAEVFNYDMAGTGVGFDLMPKRGFSELLQETDDWTIKRNGAGAAHRYWKRKSGTPEHIDFLMNSREVWERDYRPLLLELDPLRVNLEDGRISYAKAMRKNVWAEMGSMFVWETMRQSMGDITLYTSLVLDPGWIHDFNRVYTDFFITHYRYIFENVGLPDGIWIYEDLGYNAGLFASPKVLSELIFPYYRELNDFFHSYNLPVVLHSCGSTAEALPLIIEAGFDALNPMERKSAGNDPFVFAEKYGDKLAFVGGLDARVFESNDRDTIKREVTAFIQGMKVRGARFVFSSDHSISYNTHYDSYLYALEVYREHMLY
jgi:uroporphyrinogen decarboxylase